MKPLLDALAADLDRLSVRALRRELVVAQGRDFASNDYLGLAADPAHAARVAERIAALAAAGDALSAPASRLLRGTTRAHGALERRLAAWKGAPSALLFPSGYQANLGVLTALVTRRDRVLSDAANHASLIDGIRLTGSHKVILPHADLAALEAHLRQPWPGGRTWVVVESLYSMDGDVLPLDAVAALCDRFEAGLVVDDAHACGLFGARGSGLVEAFGVAASAVAVISTFGKALAATGAAVTGPAVVIDHLVNRCRPFVFSTALSPLAVAAIDTALDTVAAEPARRHAVLERAERLRRGLRAHGIDVPAGGGPIVPVIVGANAPALALAASLIAAGFDARAVRPPTVPPGTARLRLSVHADHDDATIDRLVAALAAAWPVVTKAGVPALAEAAS